MSGYLSSGMSGITEKQKVVLGDLANKADEHAKKVLTNYRPDRSYNTNLANLKKCNAPQLESCAKLLGLKVRSDDGKDKLYKNLSVVADRVIMKIESLFEVTCSDCNATYQNPLGTNPMFSCRLCMQGSHDCEEIKTKAEAMSTTNPAGFVWMCHVCLSKNDLQNLFPDLTNKALPKAPNQNTEPSKSIDIEDPVVKESEEDESEELIEEETGESLHSRISPRRGQEEQPYEDSSGERREPKKPGETHQSNAPICELYKKRKCPHGRSGTKKVEGKTCEMSHPKRCFKFCDLGPRHQNGCKKGKKCQFWHPRICKYSLKNQECEDTQCPFQHLKFTRPNNKRPETEGITYKRDRKQEKPRPADRNLNVPKFSIPHSTVDVTPYPPTVGKPLRGKEQQTDEKSFLLKLMENMRAGFQDQIDEIKNEIRQRGPSQDKLPQPAQKTAEVSNAAIQSLLGSYQTNTAQPSLAHYHYLLAQQLANQSYPRLSC